MLFKPFSDDAFQ